MAEDSVDVRILLDLQGASRQARSYAFLYAAFDGSGANSVRDILDCLIPFIAVYTNSIAGKQINLENLQVFLRSQFGFDIPIYTLQQLLQTLRARGYIKTVPGANIYVAVQKEDTFTLARRESETEFDEISNLLAAYARSRNYWETPPSGSWEAAIINFLKPKNPSPERKVITIHKVLLDARDIEYSLVGGFIRNISDTNPDKFNQIVKIFMGTLVEDFLSNISEADQIDKNYPLVIFYDTGLLLRVLGCSGRLFRTASEELTRYLQDIGCEIRVLPGNEAEVAGVFSAMLRSVDTGGEIEGETGEAISRGEVSVNFIRMLDNNFIGRLAQRNNIFEFDENSVASETERHQINEVGFSSFLAREAVKQGRNYGPQNRQNDAGYLGTVMRLRKGTRTRDFGGSKYIFVTSNAFLASAAKSYLIKEGHITASHCPPILYVTQAATIAWLLKDKKLSPDIAGRELLLNCLAATQPNKDWFLSFRKGMEELVGDLGAFVESADNSLVLQAARRIAQEESFGSAAIVRELSLAEILDESRKLMEAQRQKEEDERKRAEEEGRRRAEEDRLRIEEERAKSQEDHKRQSEDLSTRYRTEIDALQATHIEEIATTRVMTEISAREMTRAETQLVIKQSCDRIAKRFVQILQFVVALVLAILVIFDSFKLFEEWPLVGVVIRIILGLVAFFHFLGLVGWEFVGRRFDAVTHKISAFLHRRILGQGDDRDGGRIEPHIGGAQR